MQPFNFFKTALCSGLAATLLLSCGNTKQHPAATEVPAQQEASNTLQTLRDTITQATKAAGGITGVAVMHLEKGDTFTLNNAHPYPMQSTFKFPLAVYILHLVDEHQLQTSQQVHITKADMAKTYSPLRDKYPNGNVDQTVKELIDYSVSLSDNNACDVLFRLAGGPAKVDAFINPLTNGQMNIKNTEEEMRKAWAVQYDNNSTPYAMLQLLQQLYKGKLLADSTRNLLIQTLEATSTGPQRIKGQLPQGTVVAHKTGTSDTNEAGITAATNDAGVITLPDGSHLAIVVFVSDSPASQEVREGTIASISKICWDHYTKTQ
jgi:beta-lactamase class A/beta-lactamase class A VEB